MGSVEIKGDVKEAVSVPGVTIFEEDSEIYTFLPCAPGKTSDGYHTFDELYEHRYLLFMAFQKLNGGWKARLHSDGLFWEGWFVAGTTLLGKSITYHLPNSYWDLCPGQELERAPKWDGH